MNTIKKLLFIFLVFTQYCSAEQETLRKVTLEEFGEFILSSIKKFDEQPLNSELLHVLCNVFFAAFEYARFDLAYTTLLRSTIYSLQNLKNTMKTVEIRDDVINKLALYEKNRNAALLRWNHTSEYINAHEEIAAILSQMTQERLKFLSTLVLKYEAEYNDLTAQLYTDAQSTIPRLNSLAHCLRAAYEKQLPVDYEEYYINLKVMDMVSTLVQRMRRELNELEAKLMGIEEYHDNFLSVCAILDMLYFNKLRELLFEKTDDEQYSTILFNEHGLIPENERKDLLPYVIN